MNLNSFGLPKNLYDVHTRGEVEGKRDKMKENAEMHRFWKVLEPLEKNEVYVILLIGKKRERQIIDTVMVKSNNFDEFSNKVGNLMNKAKRMPFECELLFDVNKKDVVEGLENGWMEVRSKINRGKDVRNFFSIFLRNIRYSQITDYLLIKETEPLLEMSPLYIIRHADTYYNIFSYRDNGEFIHKPEVPIPGTVLSGEMVQLYYISPDLKSAKNI